MAESRFPTIFGVQIRGSGDAAVADPPSNQAHVSWLRVLARLPPTSPIVALPQLEMFQRQLLQRWQWSRRCGGWKCLGYETLGFQVWKDVSQFPDTVMLSPDGRADVAVDCPNQRCLDWGCVQ